MEEISRIQPISRATDPVQRIERRPDQNPRQRQQRRKPDDEDIIELHSEEEKPEDEESEGKPANPDEGQPHHRLDISA